VTNFFGAIFVKSGIHIIICFVFWNMVVLKSWSLYAN